VRSGTSAADRKRQHPWGSLSRSSPNPALQLPSAYLARARRLRGLHPRGGFKVNSSAVIRAIDTVALAAERRRR
jgi:hypothetical protein